MVSTFLDTKIISLLTCLDYAVHWFMDISCFCVSCFCAIATLTTFFDKYTACVLKWLVFSPVWHQDSTCMASFSFKIHFQTCRCSNGSYNTNRNSWKFGISYFMSSSMRELTFQNKGSPSASKIGPCSICNSTNPE